MKKKKQFGEKEFVDGLWKEMKQQEKTHPEVALLHERLEGNIQLIGLTGGIASGKSTVSAFLKEKGIPVIDADEIAREVVRPGKKAWREIGKAFGEGVMQPDKNLDREKLGSIVFFDTAKKALLESITHPEILKEIAGRIKALKKKKSKLVVIDAALLFESGLHEKMHKNILVRIHPDTQLKRLMARDKISKLQAWQKILSQMPSAEKEKGADLVIDNSGDVKETHRQVLSLLEGGALGLRP